MKMESSVKITLIIVSAVLLLAVLGISVYFYSNPQQTIKTEGVSEIRVIPDRVVFYFSVITESKEAKDAKDKNAEIVEKIINNLVSAGFEKKNLVTESFSIYPKYTWEDGKQKMVGYEAAHSLKLEFSAEEIDKVSSAIDITVNAGASISYINFELSSEKQNQYKAEALKKATEDARTKAEAIASGIGKKIMRVVSTETSDFNYYPWRLYEGSDATMAKEATTNIQPGEQTISARVTVVYALA